MVDFREPKKLRGPEGLRQMLIQSVHSNTSHQLRKTTWETKRYLPNAVKGVNDTGQTLKQHT